MNACLHVYVRLVAASLPLPPLPFFHSPLSEQLGKFQSLFFYKRSVVFDEFSYTRGLLELLWFLGHRDA